MFFFEADMQIVTHTNKPEPNMTVISGELAAQARKLTDEELDAQIAALQNEKNLRQRLVRDKQFEAATLLYPH